MDVNQLLMFDRHARAYFPSEGRVLEIGPEARPSIFEQRLDAHDPWETAELRAAVDESGTRKWGPRNYEATHWLDDEYVIPVKDGTFDVVFSANVVEHVRQIWRWMAELARITRPGGHVVTIAPVSYPLHPSPYDCWRIYPDGGSVLSEHAGLEPLVSVTEGVEPCPSRRTYPGVGLDPGQVWGRKRTWLGRLGWPLPVSVDTLIVARKPVR